MIFAGDIGGTKCNLALFEGKPGALKQVFYERYPSHAFSSFEDIVKKFLSEAGNGVSGKISAAGIDVAGPVIHHQVHATNVPWIVDGASLERLLKTEHLLLLNDLEATAYSLDWLPSSDFFDLNKGTPDPQSNRALIAAGTGLGESLLYWDGHQHRVSASEGGHADLGVHADVEIDLLRYLIHKMQQVDCEAILSGRGFRVIHEFLDPSVQHPSFLEPASTDAKSSGASPSDAPPDPAAEITHLALTHECPVCVRTLDIWVSLYGAEAGNLAVRSLARAGVYVAGGIAVKILPKLKDGEFFRAFCNKVGVFSKMLAQIPVRVVLNQDAPLVGAATQAALSLG